MKLIDEKLGGTTPLEVILKFPDKEKLNLMKMMNLKIGVMMKIKMMKNIGLQKIRLIKLKLFIIILMSLPAVGKVLSFSSIIQVATQLNNNKPLGTLEMGVLYSKIPESIKKDIIDPYISIKDNEARISLRIIDSQDG